MMLAEKALKLHREYELQVKIDDSDTWHRPAVADLANKHTGCGKRYPDSLTGVRPSSRDGKLCQDGCFTDFELGKVRL